MQSLRYHCIIITWYVVGRELNMNVYCIEPGCLENDMIYIVSYWYKK